jgi:hypothetical protein
MKNPPPLLLATCFTLCLTWNAQGQIDSNNNGMGDEWEKAWNNGHLFPSTILPQADDDNDGWTNLQESTAGTNPFDGNPPNGILLPEISVIPATYEPLPPGEQATNPNPCPRLQNRLRPHTATRRIRCLPQRHRNRQLRTVSTVPSHSQHRPQPLGFLPPPIRARHRHAPHRSHPPTEPITLKTFACKVINDGS